MKSNVQRLREGELVISTSSSLHRAMEILLTEMGRPRPPGMTLSLVRPVSPHSYWSSWQWVYKKPYRLRFSTNPDDFIWEDNLSNLQRNAKHNQWYREAGLLRGEGWKGRIYLGPSEEVPSLKAWLRRGESPLKQALLKELEAEG